MAEAKDYIGIAIALIFAYIILSWLHKNWKAFRAGEGGWVSKVVHPFFLLWDKLW